MRYRNGSAAAATGGARMGTRDDVNAEIAETLSRFHLLDVMNELDRDAALRQAARCSRSRSPLRPSRACCCSTSPRPACPKASATISSPPSPPCRATSPVLLIEHDMDLVFSFADRISVLVNGAMLVEGPPGRGGARSAGQGRSISARPPMPDLLRHQWPARRLRRGGGAARHVADASARARCWRCSGRNGTGKTTLINLDRRHHPPLWRHRQRSGRLDITADAAGPAGAVRASAGCRRSAISSAR